MIPTGFRAPMVNCAVPGGSVKKPAVTICHTGQRKQSFFLIEVLNNPLLFETFGNLFCIFRKLKFVNDTDFHEIS
jgi:hypothetical protein